MAAPVPDYDVVMAEGAIELRAYPAMAAAEVTVVGARDDAANAAFRPLFNYISGANVARAKIEMTAPVTQAPKGEKIEMTAPVTQSSSADGAWTVRFLLPARYTAETAPQPTDPNVRIIAIPAMRMVAARFSGRGTPAALDRHETLARAFIAERKLRPVGPVTYAFYDAPFTLPMFRRNEVMIEVEQARRARSLSR